MKVNRYGRAAILTPTQISLLFNEGFVKPRDRINEKFTPGKIYTWKFLGCYTNTEKSDKVLTEILNSFIVFIKNSHCLGKIHMCMISKLMAAAVQRLSWGELSEVSGGGIDSAEAESTSYRTFNDANAVAGSGAKGAKVVQPTGELEGLEV